MNRIILIGNGFDLAHGMKTSYNDFIDDFWKEMVFEVGGKREGSAFENDFLIVSRVPSNWIPGTNYKTFKGTMESFGIQYSFKNKFLERIMQKQYVQNWVDIEDEYYKELKAIIKKNGAKYSSSIPQLNKDFAAIQKNLEAYLNKVEDKFKSPSYNAKRNIGRKIYSSSELS